MTKYWPASVALNSLALKPEQKVELMNYRLTGISEQTFQACRQIVSQARGYDITMLHTEGAPLKRVYLTLPTQENWLALELCVFIDTGSHFGFNVEALH